MRVKVTAAQVVVKTATTDPSYWNYAKALLGSSCQYLIDPSHGYNLI